MASGPQHFAVFFVGNYFDEAAVIAKNGGFAVADKRKLARFHGVAGIARLLFGQADGADLRLAVGCIGDAFLDDGWPRLARDVCDGGDALHHGGVGQQRQAENDVADGVQALFRGLHVGPDVYGAALDFGFRLLQAAVFGHRFAANRQKEFLGY